MPGFVTECKPPMRVFLRTEQIPVKHNRFEREYHRNGLSVPLYFQRRSTVACKSDFIGIVLGKGFIPDCAFQIILHKAVYIHPLRRRGVPAAVLAEHCFAQFFNFCL